MTPLPKAHLGRVIITALVTGALALLLLPDRGPAEPTLATAAPSSTAPPTISGTAVRGRTLTATSGTWSGTTPMTFAFRWLRCDSSGSSCQDISGATSSTYVVESSAVGARLRVRVQASNEDGTAAVLSDATAVVTEGTPPTNTAEPRISGTATEGQTLSTTSGSWSGSPTAFAYQWVRCGSNGGRSDGSDCAFADGATSSSYTLSAADVGRRIRVRVSATNAYGTKTVASNPTGTVKSASSGRPVNTAEPVISGTPAAGQTLTTTPGSWSSSTSFSTSYRWVRCGSDGGKSDGSNCSSISGATSSTFTPGASEIGRRLRVRVTARNASGSTTVASNPTAVIGPAAPAGTITLPSGERSIPVTSVPADQRLVVDSVVFSPSRVTSRTTPIVVRIRVKDTRGYVVRDARIFIRSTPLVTTGVRDASTGTDGWLTVTLTPLRTFPQIRRGYSVQFYVKTYRTGDPTLGGVAGTRLVQVPLGR